MAADKPLAFPDLDPEAVEGLFGRVNRLGIIDRFDPLCPDDPAPTIEAVDAVMFH
jgi:hypothetical protein